MNLAVIPNHPLQPCDVILYEGSGLLSRGIEWLTKSLWSHAAMYVGGGKALVVEACFAGVRVAPFSVTVVGHKNICVRRRPGLTVEQSEAIKSAAYSLVYHPYDFKQLLSLGAYNLFLKAGIRLPFLIVNSRAELVCSEVIAVAYGVALISFATGGLSAVKTVTPDTLYNTPELVTVLETAV